MSKGRQSYHPEDLKPGTIGDWWHEGNRGPLKKLPFINQFGHMKFTRVNLDENMKPHFNNGIEIHYVESGKYDWEFEGKNVELLPDDLSITAPWQLNGSPSGKMDLGKINWLVIKPESFAPGQPLNLGDWTKLSRSFQKNLGNMIAGESGIVLKNATAFKKYFIELSNELAEQEEGYEMIVTNLIENMLITLNRELESRKLRIEQQDSFIQVLNQTIASDFSKKWVVEDLALAFGMGKTKFTEEVKKLTGYPPNSYIINLKIDKAKELLTERETYSLSDISYECGFSSVQHFTSAFAQRTGVTPATFRNNHRIFEGY